MLREGEKEGKTSWSGGAVHFFCYSFDRLFRKLFRKVDTAVCGGPWNEDTSGAGDLAEKTHPDQTPLQALMTTTKFGR